ncbi:hypothetical protein LC653_39490 [Nostoc sp. CHAB 5784]|uniref:hypothetical protein n=1 Tax=Nostoc mirabile TaxID=2907820 RepID=UPI001E531453|nr:hypothetical protein [Nostoc mirabile]MCC5669733.1 hypothetical protein [Nostoc mirabile CHAB5784]
MKFKSLLLNWSDEAKTDTIEAAFITDAIRRSPLTKFTLLQLLQFATPASMR